MWRKPSHWLELWVFQPASSSSWPDGRSCTVWVNFERPNSGGPGSSSSKFNGKTAPVRMHDAPSWTGWCVSGLRQPNTSPSPQSPHDDPGGAPATAGSSSYEGSGFTGGGDP